MLRTRTLSALVAAMLVSAAALAAPPPVNNHPELHAIAGAVQASNLHATDAALVGFGTRHTLSTTTSKTRGIGAARRWVAAQFEYFLSGSHLIAAWHAAQVLDDASH